MKNDEDLKLYYLTVHWNYFQGISNISKTLDMLKKGVHPEDIFEEMKKSDDSIFIETLYESVEDVEITTFGNPSIELHMNHNVIYSNKVSPTYRIISFLKSDYVWVLLKILYVVKKKKSILFSDFDTLNDVEYINKYNPLSYVFWFFTLISGIWDFGYRRTKKILKDFWKYS